MGRVKSTKIGFKNVLRMPNTTATATMVVIFSTFTPGII